MTAGNRSRVRHFSLSVAGVLVVVLLVGPAFVPQQLRAGAAARFADLTQYLDTAWADAWHSASPSRAPDNRAVVTAKHPGSGSRPSAPLVLTDIEAPPSTDADAGFMGVNSFEARSFSEEYAGSASNSITGLLDLLKDGDPEAGGNFDTLAMGSGYGNGPAGSGGAGGQYSSGIGGAPGGAGPTGLSGSSSDEGASLASAASHGQNSDGAVLMAAATPAAHLNRLMNQGGGSYGNVGMMSKQVVSSKSSNGLSSSGDSSGGPHDGGGGDTLNPTNGDPGQPVNGWHDPLPGEGPLGPVFHDGDSGGGDGVTSSTPNDPPSNGPIDQPVITTDPDPGPVASVPEPGSLALLSSVLGAILLWRKFRPAR